MSHYNKLCRKRETLNRVRGFSGSTLAHLLGIKEVPDDSTAAQAAILKVAV